MTIQLIADDHQVVLPGIGQFRTATDIDVMAEAENGEQAIQFIEQHQPDVAVLERAYLKQAKWPMGL